MGDVDDLSQWLCDFKLHLKSSSPLGALTDTAQKQFDRFMVRMLNIMILIHGQPVNSMYQYEHVCVFNSYIPS